MRAAPLLCTALLLGSCTSPVVPPLEAPEMPVVRQSSSVSQALEQVPSELSLPHFAQMRLEGRDLTLISVLEENAAYTRYNISYRSNGLLISGILNIPEGEGPFPLVMLNHGHIDPDEYTNGRGLKREQDYLARQGFAVLHTDYRGHAESDPSPLLDEESPYDAGLEYSMDSANAILAVRAAALPQIDAEHVGMLGHSLGGGVTLNIAVARPGLVDAVVLYAPVSSRAWDNFTKWRSRRLEGERTQEVLGTRETHPEVWDRLSSRTYLKDMEDPVLLFHGTEDESVPIEWSEELHAELLRLGKDVTFVTYEGEKHEFVAQWEDFMRQTTAFFAEHLRLVREGWMPPLEHALQRVTRKPFGIRIEKETSPVQPERFAGYHTGTDFELLEGEQPHEVTVRAACNGSVVFRDWVSGYGGVLVQRCSLAGEPVTVLYGHLSLTSIAVNVSDALRAGDRLGVLGEGYSEETDGERPHLHFAVHRGEAVELKGYVQRPEELPDWQDPMQAISL